MAASARLGLKLGLVAFLLNILTPLFAPLLLLFMVAGVGSASILSGDARRRPGAAKGPALVGLLVLAGGFLALVATNVLANVALDGGDLGLFKTTAWMAFGAEALIAAGFYFVAHHLALDRSRRFLGLALGAALAISLLVAVTTQGAADTLFQTLHGAGSAGADPSSPEFQAAKRQAMQQYSQDLETPVLLKALPYVAFAWAYSAMLGRLRAEAKAQDPWKLP